jgi:hypothetical protein
MSELNETDEMRKWRAATLLMVTAENERGEDSRGVLLSALNGLILSRTILERA